MRVRVLSVVLLGLLPISAGALGARRTSCEPSCPVMQPVIVTEVPFGPGERLEYLAKWGWFDAGEGSLEVVGVESVRGWPSYRINFEIEGGIAFAKVDDEMTTWLDVRNLVSRRFVQNIHEVRYRSFRQYEIYPEERRVRRVDKGLDHPLPTGEPLDDLAFVYFARTLPLNVGDLYVFNRYFKQDGNPVRIRVLRRDEIEVPAGTFKTIVVQPIIKTDGLFGEGGRAEIHFSDDEHRHVVYMKTELPIGSLTLHLKGVQEGEPLRGAALDQVLSVSRMASAAAAGDTTRR